MLDYIFQSNTRRHLKIDFHPIERLKKVKPCALSIEYSTKRNTSLGDTWLVSGIDKKRVVRILEKMLL